jgi:hypothetical protein
MTHKPLFRLEVHVIEHLDDFRDPPITVREDVLPIDHEDVVGQQSVPVLVRGPFKHPHQSEQLELVVVQALEDEDYVADLSRDRDEPSKEKRENVPINLGVDLRVLRGLDTNPVPLTPSCFSFASESLLLPLITLLLRGSEALVVLLLGRGVRHLLTVGHGTAD